MKLVSLVGARPQIIKEAMINSELRNRGMADIVVHSGQHYDYNMSDVFFETLDISEPAYNLGITSSKHGEMTGRMIIGLEKLLDSIGPDALILFGDTNTTLAGAITASKMKIPIIHIEAGLRQKPADMPEEINRVVTDRLSSMLFCPSELSARNLMREGISNNVHVVGDVMYDLFLRMKPMFKYTTFDRLSLESGKYVIVTLHRDFNVDNYDSLKDIVFQINRLSKEVILVWPLHPRTRRKLAECGLDRYLDRVNITEPLEYLDLMGLLSNSMKIITDSGGLQKEAYFCGKHAIVVMPDTGWRELVENKWNKLADGRNLYEIAAVADESEYIPYIYGHGDAASKITEILLRI